MKRGVSLERSMVFDRFRPGQGSRKLHYSGSTTGIRRRPRAHFTVTEPVAHVKSIRYHEMHGPSTAQRTEPSNKPLCRPRNYVAVLWEVIFYVLRSPL